MATGRPKKTLDESDYPRLALLASRGLRKCDVARELGLSPDTLRRVLAENERAGEAYQQGLGVEHEALVGSLFRMATHPTKPNALAAIFLLRARHNYQEAGNADAGGGKVSIVFQLPAPLSPEQYEQVVKMTPPLKLREVGSGE